MGVTNVQVHRVGRHTRVVGSWHYGRVQVHPSPSPGSFRRANRSGAPALIPATRARRDGSALSGAMTTRRFPPPWSDFSLCHPSQDFLITIVIQVSGADAWREIPCATSLTDWRSLLPCAPSHSQ